MSASSPVVSARGLARMIAGDRPVRVLDVRWSLAEPDGRAAFEAGHVPGAVYVDLETELSDHSVSGRGRHPLPQGEELERALRRWGVDDGDTIVAYDDWNRAGASRAWWVLRAAGRGDVHILDGGLAAGRESGGELETGRVTATSGSVSVGHRDLYSGAMPTVTADDAARLAAEGALLDARAPERFRGEIEPVDPVAGHVPGASNLPSTAVLTSDGRFRAAAELAEELSAHGVDGTRRTATYCGSGVTAAVVVAAARRAGLDLALFPGSWSEWVSRPDAEVETGNR
ncbi:sulfurtransferase [Rhodococcus sp. HNM0569]|uniref:sulfurtransferase n=1 Tax=Rhodococcus sp. HNM0569 TaxID=2716340 RepID=UPI00146D0CF4|nr:sulfurtransferase [Rhodococcus sp. HNM0569]NLU82214.1 sulfurtransferase [Rhodococcus sp. HNM0569]